MKRDTSQQDDRDDNHKKNNYKTTRRKKDIMTTAVPEDDPFPSKKTESSSLLPKSSLTSTTAEDENDSYVYDNNDDDDNTSDYSYTSLHDDDNDGLRDNWNARVVAANHAAASPYRFWNLAQVRQSMQDTVQEYATDFLGIPPEAALVILRKYQWDGKKLLGAYYAAEPRQIWTECGVLHRCLAAAADAKDDGSNRKKKTDKSTGFCSICLEDDLGPNELFHMACGHEFCYTCWNGYLSQAVTGEGPACVDARCPNSKCTEIVTEVEVTKLTLPTSLAKYQGFELRSYVESNNRMRWCPGKACDAVAVAALTADGFHGEGQCPTCMTRFCLGCGDMRHTPASCKMMDFWTDKNHSDSESANWILAKTKKCPKCCTRIDKNGGCNHMTCSQCKHHFCWMCMQDWNKHGYNSSCNAFDVQKAQSKDPRAVSTERELERYLHCYSRFHNHAQGQDFAQSSLDKFKELQDEKRKSDSSFDWEALGDALAQLVECRRVLKHTYVVTYCMEKNPVQQALYEDHQGQLENFTERLSRITEKEYTTIDRAELINLTSSVQRYTKSLMDLNIDNEMELRRQARHA